MQLANGSPSGSEFGDTAKKNLCSTEEMEATPYLSAVIAQGLLVADASLALPEGR